MDTILGNRNVWQIILAFLTDGAFILDVSRRDGIVLTHPLAALRRTCKAMRDMIPAPAGINPEKLFNLSGYNGNLALFEFTLPRLPLFIKNYWGYRSDSGVQDKISRMMSAIFESAAEDGHLNIVEFALNTPFCGNINPINCVCSAIDHNHWDICHAITRVYPYAGWIMAEAAVSKNRMDVIAQMRSSRSLCHDVFVAAINASRIDLCEEILDAGDITIDLALHVLGYRVIGDIHVLAFHRKYLKKTGRLSVDFYMNVMNTFIERDNAPILRTLHAWAVEDDIRPDYDAMLRRMYNRGIAEPMFDLIRIFARE